MITNKVPMKNFWKLAALIALVAIPLIIVAKKKVEEKGLINVSGDETDLFECELSSD